MLAGQRIRSQMYYGVTVLVIVVTVLSLASFQGSLKFRKLTKSIKARANELPLAAKLSHEVSDLRSEFWRLQYEDNKSSDAYESALNNTRKIAPTRFDVSVDFVRGALRNYRAELQNDNVRQSLIGDNAEETELVAKIEGSLMAIQSINQEGWAFDSRNGIVSMDAELVRLQRYTNELPGFLKQRMDEFSKHARAEYYSWMVVSAILTVFAVLLAILLYQRFYRRIFKPLEQLVAGSRAVARGDYDTRIVLETNDEVAELADALNAMTNNFQSIQNDLNQQVKQRTKEVVRSEKMASVGFLAAGVAHEINNPLATIAWSAESLESRLQDILDPNRDMDEQERDTEIAEMKKYLTRIQEEAFRCKGITSGLLDFSRMGDVKKVSTNLYRIVESVIEMVSPLSKYREKKIDFHGDPAIYSEVNEQEIKQVMLNLITNALDSVSEGKGRVRVDLERKGGSAILRVTDNGCGMTSEVMKHLFEPFFTRRRDGQGTGLGLSITYQIIEDHSGRIIPYSEGAGKGSSFTVTLPLVKNEQKRFAKKAA